jgi:hypothetical protein
MVAARSFDPRLMWDAGERGRRGAQPVKTASPPARSCGRRAGGLFTA